MINIVNKEESREIIIRPCLNGFIVMVGCTTVIFGSLEELIDELTLYLNSPNEYVKKIYELRGFTDINTDPVEIVGMTP